MKCRKRQKHEVIEGVQNALERRRKFDCKTITYGGGWQMPDGSYKYRQPWYGRAETGVWRGTLSVLAPILLKLAYGARVEGRENLKAIKGKGAIALCNHIHYLDTLFIRQAVGHFKSFHTMAPFNNKGGLGGHIIRHGGMWPFSSDLTAMRNLNEEMERQLKRGGRIVFFPEQEMWWNYQKPRPMKDGAFHYAVKFGAPILPVFCTFQKTKRGRMTRLRINVLPAVYANGDLPKKERIRAMKEAAEREWQACYEAAYGIPLQYLN